MPTFKLEITTPDGVVFKGDVEHVRAPGMMGSFGVLYSHTPFITPLTLGKIEIRTPDGERIYATSGGLADVRANTYLILAETAEEVGDIDIERAKEALERARKRLHDPSETIDHARARAAFMRATNRLKIAKVP